MSETENYNKAMEADRRAKLDYSAMAHGMNAPLQGQAASQAKGRPGIIQTIREHAAKYRRQARAFEIVADLIDLHVSRVDQESLRALIED